MNILCFPDFWLTYMILIWVRHACSKTGANDLVWLHTVTGHPFPNLSYRSWHACSTYLNPLPFQNSSEKCHWVFSLLSGSAIFWFCFMYLLQF